MNPLWVSIGVNVLLVGITAYYAYETMRIRRETLRPKLSLHFANFAHEGGPSTFILRNTGPVARNLKVIIKQKINDGVKDRILFLPSLNTGEECDLPSALGGFVTICITCKDSSNGDVKDELPPIDFSELNTRWNEIPRVSNPEIKSLNRLRDSLDRFHEKINSSLQDISKKIDKH